VGLRRDTGVCGVVGGDSYGRLDLIRCQPPLHDLGDELRAVVTPQILRWPMLRHRFLQPVQYIRRPQRPLRPQHMSFTRVFIQDRQHLQGSTTHRRVGNEVPRPNVIPMRRRGG